MLFTIIIRLWIGFILFSLLVLIPLGFKLWFDSYSNGDNSILTTFGVGLIIFLIQMVLLYLVSYKEKYSNKGLKYGIIAVILGLIGYGIFFLSNPEYVYNHLPASYYYSDDENLYVKDIDKYKYYLKEYGIEGKPFLLKTPEDHVELLKYAVEIRRDDIYQRTVESATVHDLKEITKLYNNKTFELYIFIIITKELSDYSKMVLRPLSFINENREGYNPNKKYKFENLIRYLSTDSNYPDIREISKYVIGAIDYYNKNNFNKEVEAELVRQFNFTSVWEGHFIKVNNVLSSMISDIQGLEHDWREYHYEYRYYNILQNRVNKKRN